jgi:transposase
MVERGLFWTATNIRWKIAMEHSASLDVSVKETAICVVDELGKVCREVKVASRRICTR